MNPTEPTSLHDLESRPTAPPVDFATASATRPRIKLMPIGLLLGVVAIGAFVAGYLPRMHQTAELKAVTVELATPTVTIVTPKPGPASPTLTLPAEIKPFVEAPILARANGYLKRWTVDIGAHVTNGQLLAEIDTPELNQQLAQTRAELAQAEAQLALAKTTAQRWIELLKTASVSEQETAEKKADLDLKAATVEAARANVHRLEDLQSFAKVTAPFDGVITARNTDVGQLIVAGGSKELFRLAEIRSLRVFVRVPQTVTRNIVPGVTADLMLQEIPGHIFPAKVVRTSGTLDATTRTLLTELEVDNSHGDILSGSYAQVRFHDLKQEAALTLPSNTLLFRSEGTQVGIVDANGIVRLQTVTLGRDFGRTLEMLDGVKPGDHVILNPADSLVSGSTVRMEEPEADKPAAKPAGDAKP